MDLNTEQVILPEEFSLAVHAATNRFITQANKDARGGHRDPEGHPAKRMVNDILGAIGEIAVAKAYARYFVPRLNVFHNKSDLFDDIEVRGTWIPKGRLILRKNDPDDRRYILVAVDNELNASLRGWCYGHQREEIGTWEDPTNTGFAHWISQSKLFPMKDFIVDF